MFVALAIASLVVYVEVRSKLHDQIDFSLIQSATEVVAKRHSNVALSLGKDASGYFQVVPSLGAVKNGGLSAAGAPVTTSAATTTAQSSTTEQEILGHDESVASGSRPYFRDFHH